MFGVPARYAGALYTAASKAGVLGKVADEFKAVSSVHTGPIAAAPRTYTGINIGATRKWSLKGAKRRGES